MSRPSRPERSSTDPTGCAGDRPSSPTRRRPAVSPTSPRRLRSERIAGQQQWWDTQKRQSTFHGKHVCAAQLVGHQVKNISISRQAPTVYSEADGCFDQFRLGIVKYSRTEWTRNDQTGGKICPAAPAAAKSTGHGTIAAEGGRQKAPQNETLPCAPLGRPCSCV